VKGLTLTPREASANDWPLPEWEALVVEAAGNVIEFWGFKANHGRIWALLYLHGRAWSAAEIGRTLRLSKGAVSMVTREMERWGVLARVRGPGAGSWLFVAETDFIAMITRVLAERELRFIARVKSDLARAERLARGKAPPEVLERMARLRSLAQLVDQAVSVFVRTARLDVRGALGILTGQRPPRRQACKQKERSTSTPKAESAAATRRRPSSSAGRRRT
jgi:DNA-binding transcriptional regulator GbsR (MarR family)